MPYSVDTTDLGTKAFLDLSDILLSQNLGVSKNKDRPTFLSKFVLNGGFGNISPRHVDSRKCHQLI